jgi:hypothetical protein
MRKRIVALAFMEAVAGAVGLARAENPGADNDDSLAFEIGGATERGLNGEKENTSGPSAALEFSDLEGLEIDAGTARLTGDGRQLEWDTDLVFNHPFYETRTLELEAGLGPEWAPSSGGAQSRNILGADVEAEAQFWPWHGHRPGCFVEPGYGYSFGGWNERSLSLSGGLLVRLP